MENRLVLKLQIFMFFIHAGNACIFPFQQVYFSDRGLTYTQIGIAFATGSLISMLTQPVWGYLSDRYLGKRKTLFFTITASTLFSVLFIKASGFEPVLILNVLNGFFICGIYPILDAYIFDVIERKNTLSYSHFRFMASAGYASANLLLGYLIKAMGISISFTVYEVLSVFALILLWGMRFEGQGTGNKIRLDGIRESFNNKRVIFFFLTVFLMNAAFMGGVSYMNELVKHVNGDVSNLGMVWFVTCIVEVCTFFFANRLIKKLGVINAYILAASIYGMKFVLDFLLKTPALIIAVQIFEGIAFTLFITSAMAYLNSETRPEERASMMGIFSAFGGFGTLSAGLLGGIALNMVNPSQLYGILAVICFTSAAFSIPLRTKKNSSQSHLPASPREL